MNRLAELATAVIAGAAGSAVAVLALGASLFLVFPVAVGVGVIILAAGRRPRSHDEPYEPAGVQPPSSVHSPQSKSHQSI